MWSDDFVTERTHDGRAFRMLNILDEYTKECFDITVERKITSHQVIERLAHFFIGVAPFDLELSVSVRLLEAKTTETHGRNLAVLARLRKRGELPESLARKHLLLIPNYKLQSW